MSIHVEGRYLKNGSGNTVQLRGVNMMGFEYSAIQQFSSTYPQLDNSKDWAVMKSWGVNVVRIPMNESSWLGGQCVAQDWSSGSATYKTINADPHGDYKAVLKSVVDRATAEGLYVILDLHLSAPNDANNAVGSVTRQCGVSQNPMADAANSVTFWTQVAQIYKTYPNVMFELFNEPYISQWGTYTGTIDNAWKGLRDGITLDDYVPLWAGATGQHTWATAGMQSMLNAVRGTGALNVVLTSGLYWGGSIEKWLTYKPTDPAGQLAAVWHAYPTYGSTFGSDDYKLPNFGENAYSWAQAVLTAGYPVVVTEYGDRSADGTVGAPFASSLLPRLDSLGISYLGWTFTVSGEPNHALIKDHNGTPTDGYGQYVKQHYQCKAAGTASCP